MNILSSRLPEDKFREIWEILCRNSQPLVKCPRCGRECYEFQASSEAAKDLREAGYDGSCCSKVLGV